MARSKTEIPPVHFWTVIGFFGFLILGIILLSNGGGACG